MKKKKRMFIAPKKEIEQTSVVLLQQEVTDSLVVFLWCRIESYRVRSHVALGSDYIADVQKTNSIISISGQDIKGPNNFAAMRTADHRAEARFHLFAIYM